MLFNIYFWIFICFFFLQSIFYNQLLTNSANHGKVNDVLSKYDFHVLPVFNVDGYVYTHSSIKNRLWRKTRTKTGYGCYGVDPNRNWNIQFAGLCIAIQLILGVKNGKCTSVMYLFKLRVKWGFYYIKKLFVFKWFSYRENLSIYFGYLSVIKNSFAFFKTKERKKV